MIPCIAISLGDVGGVGPEVTLKALAAELALDNTRYLLIGDERIVRDLLRQLAFSLAVSSAPAWSDNIRVRIHNPVNPLPDRLSQGDPLAARAALAWLREGAERCLRGEAAALVTAPVNKESIIRSGESFTGQTEFLSALANTQRTSMMLLGCDDRQRWLRVALATTHIPLNKVATELKQSRIELAVELANEACHDLDLSEARIAVCGLNPHAGEGGQVGDEELTIIAPAVRAARERGLNVVGPLSADTLFHAAYEGRYDAVVAMYHDQGLVPLKMIAFNTGVNWTLGLPFIRTSPDHGTAYDIAGQNKADPGSMIAAIRLAKKLAHRRLAAEVGASNSPSARP